MAAHAEDPDGVERAEAADKRDRALLRARVVGFVAGVVRWIGLVAAILLAGHVLLTVAGANQDNGITRFFADVSDPLALGFTDLFTPDDAKLRVLVNFGIAALFWLVVTGVIAKLLRRLS